MTTDDASAAPVPDTPPVWFISGCSTGFGHELARAVLARGWRVAATARDRSRLDALVAGAGDRALALDLDVTDAAQVRAAVAAAEARFGRIDVLVNNAGHGDQASIEEGDEAEIRAQFDANVFGLFALTRAVLPGIRARRRGHVLNVSSVAGLASRARATTPPASMPSRASRTRSRSRARRWASA